MSEHGNRRFIVHAAHTVIGTPGGQPEIDALERLPALTGNREGGRFAFLSGTNCRRSQKSLDGLRDCLTHRLGARCRLVAGPGVHRPCRLADLFDAEALIVHAVDCALGPLMQRRLEQYCRHGGALVVIGASGHTFSDWPEFDASLVGVARDVSSSAEAELRVIRIPGEPPHAILRGVHSFSSRPAGDVLAFDSRCTSLLGRVASERIQPVAWIRAQRGCRVFATTLGRPEDFAHPSFVRLLLNAIGWAAGREVADEA